MNSRYFNLIVEYYDKSNMKYITHNDLIELCKNLPNIKDWYLILHDKDLKDDGNCIRPHYHICLYFDNNGYEEYTIIHKFASYLECNINIIQCKSTNSKEFPNHIRYLIHLDSKDKFQYPVKEVCTNNEEYLKLCLDGYSPYECGIQYIWTIVKSSYNIVQVFDTLGLKYSNQYYKIITKLRDSRNLL